MTISIAVTGKGGSGKTTIVKSLWRTLKKHYPDKSILLFDNDLTSELAHSFGLDIRNTIYGIRSGKHEYRTGIPENMTKSEYVEWALEDIIVPIDDNTDIIVSWLIGSKDCRCPITKQINDALVKLFKRYDFILFDCEFDLKYLCQLVDIQIDCAIILALPNEASIDLAKRIEEYSAKYAAGTQITVILNRVDKHKMEPLYELLERYSLSTIGIIPKDMDMKNNRISLNSKVVDESMEDLFYRLNLPVN